MKNLIVLIFTGLIGSMAYSQENNFYQFKVNALNGTPFDLSQLKGKKVMLVNTASKCGFTPQYADLEALYKQYKDQNFIIIGFPANNFLHQEPGSNAEIAEFCQVNYGVTFPMMEKISVKGKDMHPLYHWLTEKSLNGKLDSEVKWNFQKYLIDEKGNLVDVLYSKTNPQSENIKAWIEGKGWVK
jgi:glutathione peroxidase